jgi:tetratricopeptide (TPR) repeat protein
VSRSILVQFVIIAICLAHFPLAAADELSGRYDTEKFSCRDEQPFGEPISLKTAEAIARFKAENCVVEKVAQNWFSRMAGQNNNTACVRLTLFALVKAVFGPDICFSSSVDSVSVLIGIATLTYDRVGAAERVLAVNDCLFLLGRFRKSVEREQDLLAEINDLASCSRPSRAGVPFKVACSNERIGKIIERMEAHRLNEAALHSWPVEGIQPGRRERGKSYELLEKALLLDATQADYHINLGELRMRDLFFKIAIDHFKDALNIDPSCVDAYAGMAIAYGWLSDYENAFSSAETACRLGDCTSQALVKRKVASDFRKIIY